MRDGGTAFPFTETVDINAELIQQASGMSLRDYFAAKAMQGLLSHHYATDVTPEFCYQIADDMLKAREE